MLTARKIPPDGKNFDAPRNLFPKRPIRIEGGGVVSVERGRDYQRGHVIGGAATLIHRLIDDAAAEWKKAACTLGRIDSKKMSKDAQVFEHLFKMALRKYYDLDNDEVEKEIYRLHRWDQFDWGPGVDTEKVLIGLKKARGKNQ